MEKSIKLTVIGSRCRSGLHRQGQEYIINKDSPLCPALCMELWHYAYPYVWALRNGATLDAGTDKGTVAEVCCPDECRVRLRIEVIEHPYPVESQTGNRP